MIVKSLKCSINSAVATYTIHEHRIYNQGVDKIIFLVYNVFSDRVAETREACDRGSSCGDSLTFLKGEAMPKPFLSFEAQINHLENNKNLTISDHDYAKKMLRQIGYFSLIGGYKTPFKNPTTKKYKDGTTLEDIVALYKFDENLRELFLKYILQIERHMRSLLSYYFTDKHGEQQIHYLNPANYTSSPKHAAKVARLISTLDTLANRNSDYPYINHQRITYGNVPLWVLVGAISFGSLSKFYSYTTQDLKIKVSKNFDKVNEKQLEQYLSVITKFRNVCAHNERLYSYNTRDDIPDTDTHKKLGIPQKGSQYTCGKRDLFALVISFRYLLPDEDFKKFKASLSRILKHYIDSTTAMTEIDLYKYMGFPANWKKISSYRK